MKDSGKKYIIIALATIAALVAAYITYSLVAYGSPLIKSVNEHLISGNELHKDSLYDDAMTEYGRAYSMDTTNAVSTYNNGTNMLLKNYQTMKNEKPQEAIVSDSLIYQRYCDAERMFLKSAADSKEKEEKELLAKASHNLGLTYHHRQMLVEAEAAYKEALRNDPKNEETRYNLAVVQYLLKQQQNQQNQQQQQNQDHQQQQDQNQQQQQQQQQEQEQQQQQEQEQQQQQEQEQQQQQDKKENYERMLNALMQDEKELRDEMEEKAAQGIKIDLEKNW